MTIQVAQPRELATRQAQRLTQFGSVVQPRGANKSHPTGGVDQGHEKSFVTSRRYNPAEAYLPQRQQFAQTPSTHAALHPSKQRGRDGSPIPGEEAKYPIQAMLID